MLRLRSALVATLVAGAALAPPVLADGDPASDVLISDTVFLPYRQPPPPTADKLRALIAATRKAGQPVRVAVIQSPADLGSVVNLWGHPREYARLLAQELGSPVEAGARGRREELIVVMPAGYGTANVPPEVDRELRGVELAGAVDSDALAAAAGYGVQELAAATGHPVPKAFDKPKGAGGSGGLTVVLVVVGLVGLVAVLIVLRIRSARPPGQSPGANA